MGIPEIALIGVGLSMDAVAVSMTNGMVYRGLKLTHYAAMVLAFAIFQGIMPLLGFYAGGIFAEILEKYAGIVILMILGIIGGKMLLEGIQHKDDCVVKDKLTLWMILVQAVATSIDAFAIGVAFTAMKVNIFFSAILIAVITGILVAIAILVGKKTGDILGCKAEILGGSILIFIGIKALF